MCGKRKRAAWRGCWCGCVTPSGCVCVHATGDALVTSLREPARFFDALYRRFLRESAPNLHALCLRGMSRVFRKHWRAIGEVEDTEHIIYLLRQSTHQEVSDRLLELLEALGEEPRNAEKLINEECLQVRGLSFGQSLFTSAAGNYVC